MDRRGLELDAATASTSLGRVLGLGELDEREVYAALDWLGERQAAIEAALARRHLKARTTRPNCSERIGATPAAHYKRRPKIANERSQFSEWGCLRSGSMILKLCARPTLKPPAMSGRRFSVS